MDMEPRTSFRHAMVTGMLQLLLCPRQFSSDLEFSPCNYVVYVLFIISTSPRLLAQIKLIVAPLCSQAHNFDQYVTPEARL